MLLNLAIVVPIGFEALILFIVHEHATIDSDADRKRDVAQVFYVISREVHVH